MINAFDTEVAMDVGINAAVLYKNIQYWCEKNRANGMHEHDGLFWTYNSVKAYKKLFPYLSDREIRTGLAKLVEKKYIAVGSFNDDGRDRTRWYADIHPIINNIDSSEEKDCICQNSKMHLSEVKDCICQNDKMHLSKAEDAFVRNGEPLPDNYQQITTHITNTKKVSKKDIGVSRTHAKEPSFDSILESAPIVKDNPELMTAFKDFIKMRARIKAPLTNRGLQLAINKAFVVGHGDPKLMTACVEQSIERSWRGIFEITDSRTEPQMTQGQRASPNPYTDLIRQMEENGSEYL